MSINHPIPAEYDFALGLGATDICATAGTILSLTQRGIYPLSLHDFAFKHDETPIPEGDGAMDQSDGHLQASSVPFAGVMAGADANDTFNDLASKLSNIITVSGRGYLRGAFYDTGGAMKLYYRRYGKWLGGSAGYKAKARYGIIDGFQGEFRALDPFWYLDTIRTVTTTVNATPKSQVTTDTGDARSRRLLIKITRTASGAVPTNPSVKNAANQAIAIQGTLAATGDYWLIDMYNGTVIKATSGGTVLASDKAHTGGQFWGIKNGTDTITITNGAGFSSNSFDMTLTWLERQM